MDSPEQSVEQQIADIQDQLLALNAKRKKLLKDLHQAKIIKTQQQNPRFQFQSSKVPETSQEKLELFERRFVARRDIYPRLWENREKGTKGYYPVCERIYENDRRLKPSEIFSKYGSRKFSPLDKIVLEEHLRGRHTVGTYAIRVDNTCIFLVADFDGDGWKEDAVAYHEMATILGVNSLIEISRSGNGAHVWIFFAEPIAASLARQLGSLILAKTAASNPDLKLDTYDRFFPNQDLLPKGGFGNLIALPLQKNPRKEGFTEFVNESLEAYSDQWAVLAKVQLLTVEDTREILEISLGTTDLAESLEIDSLAIDVSNETLLSIPAISDHTTVIKKNVIIPKEGLPIEFIGRLKALATFPNPVFYEKQRMRFPTYNIPRYIFSGELHRDRIALPRGCLEDVIRLFAECGARIEIEDKRFKPQKYRVKFTGKLTNAQNKAIDEIKKHDIGVLIAPPGSGKTVMACAMIGKRKVATLVLVNRQTLLEQWHERISSFLDLDADLIGQWKGKRKKFYQKVDVVMMQSLASIDDINAFFRDYDFVIIDECHHVPSVTFEALMKECPSKYILGLTATPKRKDGLEQLLFQQCSPIRYIMPEPNTDSFSKNVYIRNTRLRSNSDRSVPLHVLWESLVKHDGRSALIISDITAAISNKRISIILSERKEHLRLLLHKLESKTQSDECCLLFFSGGLGKRAKSELWERLNLALKQNQAVCLFATSSLLGEGFDLPQLDTLFLAMPISFPGRLVQYAGRLHRPRVGKKDVRIYDYLDEELPVAQSMYRKRSVAYRQMGYQINQEQKESLFVS